MIMRSMRRVLSGIVLATYLMIYAAPMGLCLAATPIIDAVINKPVLRSPMPTPPAKVAPVVKAATPATSVSSALKLEGDISISKGNPKITLSLRDSDVKQVLRMLADKAGLNIVFHRSVDSTGSAGSSGSSGSTSSTGSAGSSGKITLDIVNMPLNDAFKLIMQVSELTYYVDHNTMVITSAEAAKTLNIAKQEMISIPVKYLNASVMADFLNKNIFAINKPGLSNTQTVITNPGSNEILIVGTQNDYIMAKKIVDKFDVKPTSTTYTVNHTTPKEMANLVCTVLFPPQSGASAPAASAASGSAGGTGLTLGQGIVACTYKPAADTGTLTSLAGNSLAVAYFPQHGTVTVSGGSAEQQELVKEFIAKNDKKQPQAYLEVSLIELSESGSQDFKNTWNYLSKNFSFKFDGATASNPAYPAFLSGDQYIVRDASSKTDPLKELYKILPYGGAQTLTYTMSYLVKNGKGRVLANPRIMITNGELSTIDLTSDYVKKVTSQIVTTSGSLTPTVQRTYDIASDDGIKVEMTPFISPEGYVTLNIKPLYSTIKEKVYGAGATAEFDDLVATLLQRRNLDLKNVRIKDGETLVIGGMIREDEQKTVSKMPFLGDLPGVGMFFRNSSTTKTKQELVIMITPKIIKDSEDVAGNSDMTL